MFLIMYKHIPEKGTVARDGAKSSDIEVIIIHAWDAKDAVEQFYDMHRKHEADSVLFKGIVKKVDLTLAVELHNTLRPEFHIVSIHECCNTCYDENEKEKENG